jgi:phosphoadenosine phosphosulfate reductase
MRSATNTINKPQASIKLDSVFLESINQEMAKYSAFQRIKWAYDNFGEQLYALTSAGTDSALMMEHIYRSKLPISVIHINTGFLPRETIQFKKDLENRYRVRFFEYSPSKKQVEDVKELELWDGDLEEYTKITKLGPLKNAIDELNVKALLTGIRSDQTDNRSSLKFITLGNNGELRINPFLDWPSAKVDNYIKDNKLPRNSLYKKGFDSVGDIHTTIAGHGREGREVMECGMHVKEGKLIKND